MGAILWPIVSWVLRTVVLKFVVFTVISLVVGLFVGWLTSLLSSSLSTDGLTGAFAVLPSGVWYFLNLFNVPLGVSIILSAYVTRFLIRRIPVVG